MLSDLTVLILTYNEAPNIGRTLDKLMWVKNILVIDSYSTDETLDILQQYPQVKVLQRQFDSFAAQCNYGLAHIHSEWVLSIDADYILSDALIDELKTLIAPADCHAYQIRFKHCILGKPLRQTLLPPRTALYRRQKAMYYEDGHAHRVAVEGNVQLLSSYIYHDDRKSVSRWLWSQDCYMILETQKLLSVPFSELSFSDRIRKQKILAPFIIFFYCFILKGGIFDGWSGLFYAFQQALREVLLSMYLIQAEKSQ